jgi:hypothetical protein
MNGLPRSTNNFSGSAFHPSGATSCLRLPSYGHKRHFWATIVTTAAVLLVPIGAWAASCKSNPGTGCSGARQPAVCSPVEVGVGQSGHCQTVGKAAQELECACVGTAAPPPPDPCSSRAAIGKKIVCNINRPNVTKHETEYPNIVFAPNDIVDVSADGCVQTGGVGDTWKRYVNPIGPGLYHGLVRIPTEPTTKGALVRIKDVIGRRLLVTGAGLPESQLVLHLGYEDNDYSDNGYDNHDDGTDDQCKTDASKGVDGGPAHVTITIFRKIKPDDLSSHFDFDVLSNASPDPNGLPFNPQWSWQIRNPGQVPNASLCHNFSARGLLEPFGSPSFADCTDQADSTSVDLPVGIKETICHVLKWPPYTNDTFSGHVNWFPVTVEGHAAWGDHGIDDDYTFGFQFPGTTCKPPTGDNRLSLNGRCGLHVEFDSDETIDNYTEVDEWQKLHDDVDAWEEQKNDKVPPNPVAIAAAKEEIQKRFDGHTILTGMFGVDSEHEPKAELHPLFAMATLRDNFENVSGDEVWLMFVRNQGDEGYCSSQIWGSGFEDYTFRLPWRAGMAKVDVNWDQTRFRGSDGTSGPTVAVLPPPAPEPGVFVTFHLGPAVPSSYIFDPGASVPFIYGALHLKWAIASHPFPSVPSAALGSHGVLPSPAEQKGAPLGCVAGACPPARSEARETEGTEEADEIEHKLAAAIVQLAQPQRKQVKHARVIVGSRIAATHILPPTGPVRMLRTPLAIARVGGLHAIQVGPASRKEARDLAEIRALCTATNNAPAGLPPDFCAGAGQTNP